MNRYVADGILDDVIAGRTVLLVTEGGPATRAALEEIATRVNRRALAGVSVRLAHGQESVTHCDGGRAVLVPAGGHGGRGLTVDVLFVDADISRERYAELAPCLVTSPVGEAMRR